MALTGTLLMVACAQSDTSDARTSAVVSPLDTESPRDATSLRSASSDDRLMGSAGASSSTEDSHPTNEPDRDSSTHPGSKDETSQDSTDAVVTALLSAYDQVVSEMSSDPGAALDPGSEIRQRWAAVVAIGTVLDSDVIRALVTEPINEHTRTVAAPNGTTYKHHLARSTLRDDGSIDFEFCEYSPGIQIDSTTGAVLDDAVSKHVGVGIARRSTGGPDSPWRLEELVGLDREIFATGTEDPCV
ncbi:MAG: hypothetical protein KDB26_00990 [Microthrixaceae bacterium]|nr:hypothetical protein [Microthrixaceae bacterium]